MKDRVKLILLVTLGLLCSFTLSYIFGEPVEEQNNQPPEPTQAIEFDRELGVKEEHRDYFVVEETFHTYHVYKDSYRVFHPHNCKCRDK